MCYVDDSAGFRKKTKRFYILLIQNMGCFELFLLAQKLMGGDHIFITKMCCSDVVVILSMYFIFLGTLFLSETITIEVRILGVKEGVCYIEKLCGVPTVNKETTVVLDVYLCVNLMGNT